ncbi:MAG: CbiX/SirB N-terminal domain-containing protein [Rhodocyclaceae bacterium]|jgi:sirohydrochlorin cobaltochelatase|nr:CbiX/SirB N-terminal domain-containing protein [Rhodocyclaceae bacterium]
MQDKSGVILFGHGARDPEWAGPMQRIQARMRAQRPEVAVELAFMEFLTPTLAEAAAGLAARGVVAITVVPVFLAQGGHLKRDVPALVDQLRQQHPACRLRLAQAVGEAEGVVAAVADYALESADEAG